ncbi:MAG: hypothetical protein OIF35_02510, partial [Cellvibrionaceae bacterium]|nr:hypothetical protein [Cellvibrionaceae bacterium]
LYLMQNHFALSNGIDINALLKGQLGQIKLAQIASDIGNTLAQISILKIAFITGAIWLISRWLLRLLCAGDFFLLSLLVLVASGIYAYYVQAGSSAGILYMAAAYIGAGVSLSHLQRQHLPKKYRLSLLEWLLAAALIIAINHFAQLNFKSPLTLDNFILPGVIGFVVALVLAVYRGRVYWPAPNLAS